MNYSIQGTAEELQNLIALINRAQISGAEAEVAVLWKQRIGQAVEGATAVSANGTEPVKAKRDQLLGAL